MADMPVRAGEDGLVGSCGGPRADRPKRRGFTAAYKLEILAAYERLDEAGERGALLRRYYSPGFADRVEPGAGGDEFLVVEIGSASDLYQQRYGYGVSGGRTV
jgi:hypothetical protein